MPESVIVPPAPVNPPAHYPQDLPAEEVRRRYLTLLGDFKQPAVPLDLRTEGEETLLPGDIVRQKVSYAVAPGERVPALHLFRKDLPVSAPGVLSIHAHGGPDFFPIGKEGHAKPEAADSTQYSYHAALAGFRVLAPDALCFGERQTPFGYSRTFMDEVMVHAELTSRGSSLAAKSIHDNTCAIDALQRLGAGRIGSIGWSGGSTQNYLLAAIEPRIEAAVCFASFCTLRHQFYQYRVTHCLYHYIPGMISAGIDWDQVASLIAPRSCFLARGGKDEGSPGIMYDSFVETIRRRCQKEGLPDSVVAYEEPSSDHTITEPMLRQSLEFLRKKLSP